MFFAFHIEKSSVVLVVNYLLLLTAEVAAVTWSDMIRNRNSNQSKKICTTHFSRLLASRQTLFFCWKVAKFRVLGIFFWFYSQLHTITPIRSEPRWQASNCYFKGQPQSIHPSVTASITHLLSHILAVLQVVVTVWKDFRLHNGHNAVLGGGRHSNQRPDNTQYHFLSWFCDLCTNY